MKLQLYHYVHCPFCIRVRMALGHLNLPYESIVLPYNDEETPLALTGTKMLPILSINGKAMNESLEILAAVDRDNLFKITQIKNNSEFSEFELLLNKLGSNVHSLAMPYWIWTPEFDEKSRFYFQSKKEQKRGPFKTLVKQDDLFSEKLHKDFTQLIQDLKPFYKSDQFSVYDVLLASHLWGLYVVPEFQFPKVLHDYLQNVKNLCGFEYHEDFWR
jgi:glutaredoxin 2